MDPKIDWLGHDSFRLTGERVIYIDPWKISHGPTADIILITHDHYDHFSEEDIDRVRGAKTVVVAPEHLSGRIKGDVTIAKRGKSLTVDGVAVQVVPAYNLRADRLGFHPSDYGGVGYIVTLGEKRIYHTGDTDQIPEMANIKCDIMLVPISGKYVMTAQEAAEAVNQVKPGLAIPMHWDDIVGSWDDANEFKNLAKVPVEILGKTS